MFHVSELVVIVDGRHEGQDEGEGSAIELVVVDLHAIEQDVVRTPGTSLR